MLETGTAGVREHVDSVRRVIVMAPDLADELRESVADGLQRRPHWPALEKIKVWLEF